MHGIGNIHEATREFEKWMRASLPVIESELTAKHTAMKGDPFSFFRGVYYRWAQLWPVVCEDLTRAPKILAVGDLHVDSFGTWRDREGRLCWGVDDFDESYPLPYTNDLVRLAASVKLMVDAERIDIKFRKACQVILEGYERTLREGGCPIVLAENETDLEKLGVEALKAPPDFWHTLRRHPPVRKGQFPHDARTVIEKALPSMHLRYKVVRRQAGLGSLGQPRFVVIADWQGGCIAREAKARRASACEWLRGSAKSRTRYYETLIMSAVRSRDPYQHVSGKWIIRRLSPDSNPIEVSTLLGERDDEILLYAMGQEAANVHLGTPARVKRILHDLRNRKKNWLRSAAKRMARTMEREWEEYAER